MRITKQQLADVELFSIQGQLDSTTSPQLETELLTTTQTEARKLVLDLSQVQMLSSAALRVLLSAAKRTKRQHGRMLLCAFNPEIQRVFEICGLAPLFEIYPTRPAALDALGAAPVDRSGNGGSARENEEFRPGETLVAPARRGLPLPPVSPAAADLSPPPPAVLPPPGQSGPTGSSGRAAAPPPPRPSATPVTPAPSPAPVPAAVPPPSSRPPGPPPGVAPLPGANHASRRRLTLGICALILVGLLGAGYLAVRGFFSPPRRELALTDDSRSARPTPAVEPRPSPAEDSPGAHPELNGGGLPSAEPTPTVPPSPSGPAVDGPLPSRVADATPPDATAAPSAPPARPNLDASSQENQQTRAAVLKRIEAAPLSQKNKDQLHQAVDRARAMGRVATIPFASGRTDLSRADLDALKRTLARPEVRALIEDPTVVLVVLGFADSAGNEQKNKEVSDRRAQGVIEALRGPGGVLNVMHGLGMGGSDLFDKTSLERNRVAEIWVVRP